MVPQTRGRRGRHRRHPARWLGPRPRTRRGRRRRRHLDGLHPPAALPALTPAGAAQRERRRRDQQRDGDRHDTRSTPPGRRPSFRGARRRRLHGSRSVRRQVDRRQNRLVAAADDKVAVVVVGEIQAQVVEVAGAGELVEVDAPASLADRVERVHERLRELAVVERVLPAPVRARLARIGRPRICSSGSLGSMIGFASIRPVSRSKRVYRVFVGSVRERYWIRNINLPSGDSASS